MSKKRTPNPMIPRPDSPEPDDDPVVNAAIDEMLAAYRRGDLEAMRMLSAALNGPFEEAINQAPPPAAPATPTVPVPIQERVRQDRQELETMDPEAGADERLLLRLVGDSLPTVMLLNDVVEHMAVHLPGLFDRPAVLKTVASAMHDALSLRNVTLSRLQGVLTTVASLRAQRRFVQRRGGQNGV